MRAGQVTDKLLFVAIYTVVAVLVVYSARGMVHYALDAGLYRDYLTPWERSLAAMRQQAAVFPPAALHDPGAYMQALVALMRSRGILPPTGNTDRPYVYRLSRFGGTSRDLLLVANASWLDLYNVPDATFQCLDRFIDEQVDPDRGRFTGTRSTDGITWVARWQY